jgi:hypothetical protein
MAFPKYNYAEELATPAELRIGRGGGWNQVSGAIAGVNYYFDAVGFGDATGFARMQGGPFRDKQQPLGVRFFANTGRRCSNGEPMYEYISTIPKGDIVGKRIQREVEQLGLPPMKGLAAGMMEDTRDALNPNQFAKAWNGDSTECKRLRARVGDARGRLASEKDPTNVWITEPTQPDAQGFPTQERWVQKITEGFSKRQQPMWPALVLLGLLGVAILSHKAK